MILMSICRCNQADSRLLTSGLFSKRHSCKFQNPLCSNISSHMDSCFSADKFLKYFFSHNICSLILIHAGKEIDIMQEAFVKKTIPFDVPEVQVVMEKGTLQDVIRPLVEKGWAPNARQIGLSGRTVRPKLIITCGVSGAIQFAACMNQSEHIIAINTDPEAPIFNVAHIAMVGDLYQIVPRMIQKLKEERA